MASETWPEFVFGEPAPEVRRALEMLRESHIASLPLGRHEIDGERIFAIADAYTTRPADRCRLEAHRRYHDIQIILEGTERIGVALLGSLEVVVPYDETRDVMFLDGPYDTITLETGQAAIFSPTDAHAPQMAALNRSPVRKMVIKVMVSPPQA